MRRSSLIPLSLLFLLFCSFQLFSQTQSTTGVIQGNVQDPSGAVVPGVDITVTETQTNLTKHVTSDSEGRFVVLALPPGSYVVTVAGKSGFSSLEQSNLVLTVGKTISLNLKMALSKGSDKVVVTDTPLIDIVKTESSTTIDQQA